MRNACISKNIYICNIKSYNNNFDCIQLTYILFGIVQVPLPVYTYTYILLHM